MHPKKNGKFFLIDPLKRAKSQKLGRNVALPIISGTEQIKEYHPTKIIIDLQKEYEEDKELLDLLDNKRNYYLPYSIESKKENNEQNCTGNISNRKKPLCEIIPEEDEDKQKTEKNFFNSYAKPVKTETFLPYPVSKTSKQLNMKDFPLLSNHINSKSNIVNLCQINNKTKLEQQKEKEAISKLIHPSSPFLSNRQFINKSPIVIDRTIETPSTSGFTHDSTKKLPTDTKSLDDFNKERMHLLSAQNSNNINLNRNNTIFTPNSQRRPLSNLNNGSGNLLDNIEKNIKKKAFKTSKPLSQQSRLNNSNRNNKLFNSNDSINFSNSISNYNSSSKKLHKIKIERGMMSTKFVDKLINKLHFDLSTQTFQHGCLLGNSINF